MSIGNRPGGFLVFIGEAILFLVFVDRFFNATFWIYHIAFY
jgi:hypothetical protein